MTSYAKYKRAEGKTPSMSEHIKNLYFAFEQPEDNQYDAMIYAFMNVLSCFAKDFLRSTDSINGTRKLFINQVRDFKALTKRFVYYTADTGVDVYFVQHNAFESLISVLAYEDAMMDRDAGKSTKMLVDGKLREVDPHKMMRDAGYDIDEDLGVAMRDELEDLGFLEIVENPFVSKKVVAKDVLMGYQPKEKPRSIFLDGPTTYKPNLTIGGLF